MVPFPLTGKPCEDALVAQLDRAPDYESGGQGFESLRVYHFYTIDAFLFIACCHLAQNDIWLTADLKLI